MGIDLKHGETPASNLAGFLPLLQAQRQGHLVAHQAVSLSQLPTHRPSQEHIPDPRPGNELRVLFVPALPFTDVE